MTKEQIDKVLANARRLGIDFGSIPANGNISSATIKGSEDDTYLEVTYSEPKE